MNWREKYAHKIVTPAEAISHIRSGDTIHSTMYSSLPYALFNELGAQKNRLEGVNIYMGFGGGLYRPLAKACNGHVDVNSLFLGPAERTSIYNRGPRGLAQVLLPSRTYGDPASVPITEDFPTGNTTNPYGTTKVFTERILTDVCKADPSLNVAVLRYFNPIGAHKSGLIGEDPNGIPNNLMPYIAKVAVGKLEKVHVFGNDYPTPDGTGVRDYIHVVDLARGHVCAIKKLETGCGLFICNLGTGKGYSVMDVLHAFEKACGKKLPYVIEARRPGDIAECYADPSKAKRELGWVAEYGIEDMCADSWNWQKNNPDGYHTAK